VKFVIAKQQLLELIGTVQNVVTSPQRAAIPILANVLVEAANDELVFTTTDMKVGIRCYTEAKILEEGATTLPARRFFQLVRELPDVNVQVSTSADHVTTIVAGASRFRLHGLGRAEFPALPQLSGAVRLRQDRLRDVLARTSFAVSREDGRYVLSGVFCRMAKGTATFVGTDGKRLARTETKVDLDPSVVGTYILPLKAVDEITRALQHPEEEATVYVLPDRVAVEAGNTTVVTKLLAGDYPDVEQVIPQKSDVQIVLHREELMSLLRQVSLFTNEVYNSVRFTFSPGELTVTANTMDIGEGKVSMPANFQKEKLEIAFNPAFFLDILRHSKDDTVTLKLIDRYNPGVITDSSDALFVLMPMRLNDA
jgi:DNA polymerase III subunit beta